MPSLTELVRFTHPTGPTGSPAAWPTVLFGLFLLAFASCQRSVPEHVPGITAAPAVVGPIETSDVPPELALQGDDSQAPEPSAGLAPDHAPEAGDSADAMVGTASESGKDGGASPDAKPDASAEYPLQANPLAGCSLCHVDIEDEFVGSLHFEEKVGCITCHGPSEGHLADENNEVKPDEVFARPDVHRLCERCHECSRLKPEKPELTQDGQRKVCTDCHGAHDVVLVQ
ncbi:MAG TPA: hypothetical protein VMY37_08495 [Thermoguttaceae bacterium]|nr:hypothetical protein [Thermoguttaceae bacterium]